MSNHFTSFTQEAMRAFGQKLADGARARAEFRASLKAQVAVMMERLRHEAQGAEQHRRARVAAEAEARQRFLSELRGGVRALMKRFERSRQDRADDLRAMSGECRAASLAFRERFAGAAGSSPRPAGPPEPGPTGARPVPARAPHDAQGRAGSGAPGNAAALDRRGTEG